ncbi:MAG: hypothetical protein AB1899_08240 [Pseudomonadota bacterium]
MIEIRDCQERSVTVPDGGAPRPLVAVRYSGRKVGLYRVKRVGEVGLLLNHGGISFPVGTRLEVDDIQRLLPPGGLGRLSAMVVDNSPLGLRLVWCDKDSGEIRWLS